MEYTYRTRDLGHMKLRIPLFLLLTAALAPAAGAQERDVPYWATVRAKELNMRVGPSQDYKIEWVYRRPGLPVKVIRVMEGWRLIRDPDGTQGWVVARLLSPERGAIVVGDGNADMRAGRGDDTKLKWRVEPGVVVRLRDCDDGWCDVTTGNYSGYIREDRLWGAGEP